jgi:hypothetical protein
MKVDLETRVIRWVELTNGGGLVAQNTHTGISQRADGSSRDEEDYFAEVEAAATAKGHTLVRLCNHDDTCRAPSIGEIEGDGNGGIQAMAEFPQAMRDVQMWDAQTMERAFIEMYDPVLKDLRMVRLEPGQWDGSTKRDPQELFEDTDGKIRFRKRGAR